MVNKQKQNYVKVRIESVSQFYEALYGSVFQWMASKREQTSVCLGMFMLFSLQQSQPKDKKYEIRINKKQLSRFIDL